MKTKLIKFGKYLFVFVMVVAALGKIFGGPSEPKSYVDITAYEIISEMVDGVQPASKNQKLMNYLEKNKGVRISGYIAGVNIDGDTAVITVVPFMEYNTLDDQQSRMAKHCIAIEAANKDTNAAMKNLRRGDFVYVDSTYLEFDKEGDIHFAGFHVDRQKAGIK